MKWHKYPEEEPKNKGEYLVECRTTFGRFFDVFPWDKCHYTCSHTEYEHRYKWWNVTSLNDVEVERWAKIKAPK